MHEEDEALFSALRAGARGYLLKGADRDEVVRAVLAVATGDAVYPGTVAQRMVGFFTTSQEQYAVHVFPELTTWEREVLDLVAHRARQPRDRAAARAVGEDRPRQRGFDPH